MAALHDSMSRSRRNVSRTVDKGSSSSARALVLATGARVGQPASSGRRATRSKRLNLRKSRVGTRGLLLGGFQCLAEAQAAAHQSRKRIQGKQTRALAEGFVRPRVRF